MDNFIGEIRLFAGTVSGSQPPYQWAFCNGQTLPISQNQQLFSLIGTTYGGDGVSTFALPNLQARVVVGAGVAASGTTYTPAAKGGANGVALGAAEIPPHVHPVFGVAASATTDAPDATMGLATTQPEGSYAYLPEGAPGSNQIAMDPALVGTTGAGALHLNVMPSLCISYIIALTGQYPQRP